MNTYPDLIKHNLFSIIDYMANNLDDFVKNPGKDFSRNRKLPFDSVLKFLISLGGSSLHKELFEFHGFSLDTVTSSAFIQQRDKILPSAFEFLLNRFNQTFLDTKDYRGYRLIAVDGSSLRIARDPNHFDSYTQNNPGDKGFNLLLLNAMYDLCNKIYVDALVQPRRCMNENLALIDMIERSSITDNVIIVADRGFECYNTFAHIEKKGWNYLIRVKDVDSSGILATLSLPRTEEFDVSIQRILTNKRCNKEINAHPDIYKILYNGAKFDFLDENKSYSISFRAVRFKVNNNSYETVITNLNQSDFSLHEIKEIYRKRWGIETSFRELKYAIGLTCFISKKQEYITQEIFARIIMYNFALMVTSHVTITKYDTLHSYQVNYTVAIQLCRYFLRLKNNAPPFNVEAMIRMNILPVRQGRKYERKIVSRKPVSFNYRVA
jgi:hypothetical protein